MTCNESKYIIRLVFGSSIQRARAERLFASRNHLHSLCRLLPPPSGNPYAEVRGPTLGTWLTTVYHPSLRPLSVRGIPTPPNRYTKTGTDAFVF